MGFCSKEINIKVNDEFFFSLLKNFVNDSDLNESSNSKIITISERTSNDLILELLSDKKKTIDAIKAICSKIGLIVWVENKNKKQTQYIHIVKIPNHWQWEYSVIDENQIKKNWPIFKDGVSSTSFYHKMWSDLKAKATNSTGNFFDIFRNFIEGVAIVNQIVEVNDETLVIKEENSDRRKKLHDLCNLIGLHHESKNVSIQTPSTGKMKQVRYLYVYKPIEWLWEFSSANPFKKSYEKKRHKKETRYSTSNDERLRRKYCCICHKNGLETELFCNVFIRGLYCEECIEEESDGEGNKMSAHKFEPIF